MTTLDKEGIVWWGPKLRALDPLLRLSPSVVEPLYVPRQRGPSDDIAGSLIAFIADEQPTRRPRKVLLCGARGSGKSTQLARVAALVKGTLHPLLVDLAQVLPEQPTTLHLLGLLGLAGVAELRLWEPIDSGGGFRTLNQALSGLFPGLDPADVAGWVEAAAALLITSGSPTLIAAGTAANTATTIFAKSLPVLKSLGARFAEVSDATRLEQEDGRLLAAAVDDIFARLHGHTHLPPVLLVDGLDKAVDLSKVTSALAGIELLRDLQVPLVLTGPIHLATDGRLRAIAHDLDCPVLYNAPVVTPEGDNGTEGMAWLCEIYEARRRHFGLTPDLIGKTALQQAARASSGLVRDFLRLLYQAGTAARRRGLRSVGNEEMEESIKDLRHFLQIHLREESLFVLDRVLRFHTPPAGEEASRLLYENYIAAYPNGDIWYRPHEVLVAYVQRAAERMRG